MALSVAGVALFYQYARDIRAELVAAEEAIREAGYPVDASEVNAFFPGVPDSENGARIYREAFAAMEGASAGGAEEQRSLWEALGALKTGEELSPALLAEMRDYVGSIEEGLGLLREASMYPDARFTGEVSVLSDSQLPEVGGIRAAAQAACIARLVAVSDRDWETYESLHEVQAHLIKVLGKEPILVSQFLRAALIRMSMTELGYVCSRGPVPEETLVALAGTYSLPEEKDMAALTFAVERCVTAGALASIVRDAGDGPVQSLSDVSGMPKGGWGANLLEQRVRLNLYRYTGPLVALGDQDWPAWTEESQVLQEEVANLDYRDPMVKLYLPSLTKATTAFVRSAASLRMIQGVLAVERYRGEAGSLPDSLGALVPAYLPDVPQDPFDSAPLRYRKNEVGYTIYTVYENLVDDGGMPMEGHGPDARDGGDWVLTVVR